jgi:hypothetical protein
MPPPLLGVAQLYRRDVPDLPGPKGPDLLQVLWCPFSGHGGAGDWDLGMVLRWRRAAEVDLERVLVDQPEPPAVAGRGESTVGGGHGRWSVPAGSSWSCC